MKNNQLNISALAALKSCAKVATSKVAKDFTHAQLLNETAKALGFESYRALQARVKSEEKANNLYLKEGVTFSLYVPQYTHSDGGDDFLYALSVTPDLAEKIAQISKTSSMVGSDIEFRLEDLPARQGGSISMQIGKEWIDFESIKCHKYDNELFSSQCPIRLSEFISLCAAANTQQIRKAPKGFGLLADKRTGHWTFVVLCEERGLTCVQDLSGFGIELDDFEILVEC